MFKLKVLFPVLLVLGVGAAAAAYVVGTRAGLSVAPAAPEALVPASADFYVGLDRGGDQGAALAHLWATYQAHPGTASALAHLRADMRKSGEDPQKVTALLSSLGDRAGLAVWLPRGGGSQEPPVAAIAQVTVAGLLDGTHALHGMATATPLWSYRGTRVYRVAFKGGGKGYGCIVSGNGVLTSDTATIKHVIDSATGHAPALNADKNFTATRAALPASRALTVYVAPTVATRLRQKMTERSGSLPPQMQQLVPRGLQRPYGLAVAASNDGVALVTTALPGGSPAAHTTPNEAAGVMGHNAILYTSQANLAAAVAPYLRLVPADSLAQVEQQTGIDLHRDILGWMTGEFAIDVNDGTSPAVAQAARARIASGAGGNVTASSVAAPALPGSIELAWHVDDPAAVQHALARITAAASHAMNTSAPLLSSTRLPDGTRAYTVPMAPGIGYAFHGHWLIVSSNLATDVGASATPLSADPGYVAAMAHVSGSGATASVSYLDVTRLLGVVDRWAAYLQHIDHGALPDATSSDARTWAQAEPLIAPLHSIVVVTRRDGVHDLRVEAFASMK